MFAGTCSTINIYVNLNLQHGYFAYKYLLECLGAENEHFSTLKKSVILYTCNIYEVFSSDIYVNGNWKQIWDLHTTSADRGVFGVKFTLQRSYENGFS